MKITIDSKDLMKIVTESLSDNAATAKIEDHESSYADCIERADAILGLYFNIVHQATIDDGESELYDE